MEASKARMACREGEAGSSAQGKRGRHSCGIMGKTSGKGSYRGDAQGIPAARRSWGRNREKVWRGVGWRGNQRHFWGKAKPSDAKHTRNYKVSETCKSLAIM